MKKPIDHVWRRVPWLLFSILGLVLFPQYDFIFWAAIVVNILMIVGYLFFGYLDELERRKK